MDLTLRTSQASGMSAPTLALQYELSLLSVPRSSRSIFLSCDLSVLLTTRWTSLPCTALKPRFLSLCSTILWLAKVSRLSPSRDSSATSKVSKAPTCHTALEQDVLTTSWKRRSWKRYLSTISSRSRVAVPESERNLSDTATASETLARMYSRKSRSSPGPWETLLNPAPECSTPNASNRSKRESRPVSSTRTSVNAGRLSRLPAFAPETPSSRVKNRRGRLLEVRPSARLSKKAFNELSELEFTFCSSWKSRNLSGWIFLITARTHLLLSASNIAPKRTSEGQFFAKTV
mmetsp:Transcript_2266/g.7600  ORF Transcript_2266/g.7600 Transcript_2266/m.7600 type:complete len:290 (-) Transcript_2266:17-886(-)